MTAWRNATGRTLSSPEWLEVHHVAKLPERTQFAQTLACTRPRTILDLGCGTGLWLDLLNEYLPQDCELIGIDSDERSLDFARNRARRWDRRSRFFTCDLASDFDQLPRADMVLAFNVFPYLADPARVVDRLLARTGASRLIIRQYDGAMIRIGPMPSNDRFVVDAALRAALQGNAEFDHYPLDRIYEVIRQLGFSIERLDFEMTQRHAPFPPEFKPYFEGTVGWIRDHLSDHARTRLDLALTRGRTDGSLYFLASDLIAVLSVG